LKRLLWVGVLLIAGLAAFGLWPRTRTAPLPQVVVGAVTQGEFVREVRASGSVEARVYDLTFSRAVPVEAVLVREGSRVAAGQALARLESGEDRRKLSVARTALLTLQDRLSTAALEANLARRRLEAQFTDLERRFKLQQALLDIGASAASEVRDLERQRSDVQGQLTLAGVAARTARTDLEGQLEAKRAEVTEIERTLAGAVLRAPRPGTVLRVQYAAGVDAGLTASGVDAPRGIRLLEANTVQVRLRLPEAESGRVKPGQGAQVVLDAFPDQSFAARIRTVGAQAETAGGGASASVPALVAFQDPQALSLARPGLTVSATITVERLPRATLVPLEALTEPAAALSAVWQVAGQPPTVRRVAVTVRSRNLSVAAVSGVESGTQVVLLPPPELVDGASVTLGSGL
jgi:HlyD family secretion protein